eukprot:ANDGO_07378.mRNA.1 Glutathione peroxidase 2
MSVKQAFSWAGLRARDIKGNDRNLASDCTGRGAVLVVNVASECGYTPQYKGLQELYAKYGGENGLLVLGFPCNQFGAQEPGSDDAVSAFCEARFNVAFPMFSKIDVNGQNTHPVFAALKQAAGVQNIKWNFAKFLVSKDGTVVKHFPSSVTPAQLESEIELMLNA